MIKVARTILSSKTLMLAYWRESSGEAHGDGRLSRSGDKCSAQRNLTSDVPDVREHIRKRRDTHGQDRNAS